jgi:hypothetical protein
MTTDSALVGADGDPAFPGFPVVLASDDLQPLARPARQSERMANDVFKNRRTRCGDGMVGPFAVQTCYDKPEASVSRLASNV